MSGITSIIDQKVDAAGSQTTSTLGRYGEELAVAELERAGYRIVITNFRVPIGRNSRGVQVTGEIDVIALDGDTLCFVEVKTRRSEEFLPATANIDKRKQRQIVRTARVYRRIFGLESMSWRYDAVTVVADTHRPAEIDILKAYWSEEPFKRKKWFDGTWDEYTGL